MIRIDDSYNPYNGHQLPVKREDINGVKMPEPPKPTDEPPGGEEQYQITSNPAGPEPGAQSETEIKGFGGYMVLLAAGLIILILVNR